MRLGELQKPTDILEISLYEAQVFLNNNPHIVLESVYDNKKYRNKIDTEKSHTVSINDLVKGQQYSPIQVLGLPIGKYINVQAIEDDIAFVKNYNNKLWFKSANVKDIVFPAHGMNMGDQCTDILIFNNKIECDQFLSALKLSFSDWQFKIINR